MIKYQAQNGKLLSAERVLQRYQRRNVLPQPFFVQPKQNVTCQQEITVNSVFRASRAAIQSYVIFDIENGRESKCSGPPRNVLSYKRRLRYLWRLKNHLTQIIENESQVAP